MAEAAAALPTWKLWLLASGMGAEFLVWGMQVGAGTAVFRSMGVPLSAVSAIWLFGPVSGIIVAPLVGAYSDRLQHPSGRRRPIMMLYTVLVVLSLLVFGNSHALGQAAGSSALGVMLAVLGFGAMDFSLNGVQTPLRALIVDLVPEQQQRSMQARVGVMCTLSQTIGFLFGSFHVSAAFTWFRAWGTDTDDYDAQAVYVCGAVVFSCMIGTCCYFLGEHQLTPERAALVPHNTSSSVVQTLQAVRECPAAISRVWAVQFFNFFGFFSLFMFGSEFFGKLVYNGDSSAAPGSQARDLYHQGVQAANLAFAMQTAVALIVNLVLPSLIPFVGLHAVLYLSTGTLAAGLGALALLSLIHISEPTRPY
eukprot:TRINITY_DN18556_c0_g1_i1.p1 TRINITY_DN18556_c0_g1~~TRINITY_DN18556_c0_g1_i1.p1  ORF type:complete len:365 (-),score=90.28 TRINITY_DN18556_c0_g1_i1:42-1136(-)